MIPKAKNPQRDGSKLCEYFARPRRDSDGIFHPRRMVVRQQPGLELRLPSGRNYRFGAAGGYVRC